MEAELKTVLDSIRESAAAHGPRLDQIQRQVDAIDVGLKERHGGGGVETKSLAQEIFEHEKFKQLGEMGGRGRVTIKIENFQQKTLTNTAVGASTSGVLSIDREPGIVSIQYRALRIRDLLRSKPTTEAVCDYVKVSSFVNHASPQQAEGFPKGESDLVLTSVSAAVRTVAHWIPVSKQCFADVAGLEEAINGHLMYGLKLKEETQILSGDNVGQSLNGLITQSTSFDTSLLVASAGWNRLDLIARALQQSERSEYNADVIILNTDDFWNMALTKNSQGSYLFGSPGATTIPRLWGRPVAVTNSITSGTFLVGSSLTALIRDRQEAIIEISDSHEDFFTKNMLAVRCEERLCLQVMRPAAWITGTFSTSP